MRTNEPMLNLDPQTPHQAHNEYLLRLVTASFCRELMEYGARERDVVNVSSYMLDFILKKNDRQARFPRTAHADGLNAADIRADGERYALDEVSLVPWTAAHAPRAATWLARRDVQDNFVASYPADERALADYMQEAETRAYHVIEHRGTPVGLIGAENVDRPARKVEMRKLVGDPAYRGQGIGTKATFLWLHHAFDVLDYNKVFIHTLDTNLRNINLNRGLGFDLEGIFYQEVLVDGRLRDVLRMSLLKETWIQRLS